MTREAELQIKLEAEHRRCRQEEEKRDMLWHQIHAQSAGAFAGQLTGQLREAEKAQRQVLMTQGRIRKLEAELLRLQNPGLW